MSKRLHPDLTRALRDGEAKASNYRIKPFPGGYIIWWFAGWHRGGWRAVDTSLTEPPAQRRVAYYAGLEPEEPTVTAVCIRATITEIDPGDYGWGWI